MKMKKSKDNYNKNSNQFLKVFSKKIIIPLIILAIVEGKKSNPLSLKQTNSKKAYLYIFILFHFFKNIFIKHI